MGLNQGFVPPDQRGHVAVAHALGDVRTQSGTVSTSAVHDDLGVWIRELLLNIALQDALAQVLSPRGVSCSPFRILTNIQQYGLGVGGQSCFGLVKGDLANFHARLVHDLEESR